MAQIGLPHLPRKLAEYTGEPGPKYRRCYDAAVEGRIPAHFDGRWSVDDADLPKIALALGLTVKASKPTASRKAQPAPTIAA